MSVAVIFFFYGYDSVVTFAVLLLSLQALDDSDQPTSQKTTRERRLVHEHQNVDGVAIFRDGRRYKSEVVGKSHSDRQNLFQLEDPLVGIERVFVAPSFRCFD